jgi:hypothetical protein
MGLLRIPLAILLAVSAVSLGAQALGPIIGPIEYNGSLTYVYSQGVNPITNVVFRFDEEIGNSLIIVNVPAGWSYAQSGYTVTLSGGALQPGQTLVVGVSCRRYLEPGVRPFTATGTTSIGEVATAQGGLTVSEMWILKTVTILGDNPLPLLGGTGLLIVVDFFPVIKGLVTPKTIERKPLEPEKHPKTQERKPEEPGKTPGEEDEEKQHKKRECKMAYEWVHKSFDINLFPTGAITMPSDDPLPLQVDAQDVHALVHTCSCSESAGGRRVYQMESRVRFEWEQLSGGGGFVSQTDGATRNRDTGCKMLFQPPEIATPDEQYTVKLRVRAIHDDPSKKPDHESLTANITMDIKRVIKPSGKAVENPGEFTDPGEVEDNYEYTLTVTKDPPINKPLLGETTGVCTPYAEWEVNRPISVDPVEVGEVVYGDYVRLATDANDVDVLNLSVKPASDECEIPPSEYLLINDHLQLVWEANKGAFTRDDSGREVVWEAPKEAGKVRFSVTARDRGSQFKDAEAKTYFTIDVLKLGIGLVKTPKDWLPEATNQKLEKRVRIYVCRDGKWTQPGRRKNIRVKLFKVSREPGVCMNYPHNGNKNPDLFFHEDNITDFILMHDKTVAKTCPTGILVENDNPPHEKHELYAVSKKKTSDCKPTLRCEDYGAICHIRATANCCVSIPSLEKEEDNYGDCKEGDNEVVIPRDENENDIADIARQDQRGAKPDSDEDPTPQGDDYAGDGLTNYEEYRGFIILGEVREPRRVGGVVRMVTRGRPRVHLRTDTRLKDVFVYDQDFMGTGILNVTGLDIHLLFVPEFFKGVDTRVVNYNHGRHHGGEQHGLYLRNFNDPALYGRSCGAGNGTPKVKTHVCINVADCSAGYEPPDRLRVTIAHELCHGLNIYHHGEGGNSKFPDPNNPGRDLTANAKGKLTSGDMDCMMRYDQFADAWYHGDPPHFHSYTTITRRADGTYDVAYLDSPGLKLCESVESTGLNDRGRGHMNPAERGNCRGQLRVKDW